MTSTNEEVLYKKTRRGKNKKKALTYFYYRKLGHFKKDCTNFITLVCTEVNLASVPINTWWLDSGATIHVSISMQGCLHCQKPRSKEKYIIIGNDTSALVEGIRTFRLLLNTGHFIDLIDTFVVPTFIRNIVSISTLEKFGYTRTFGNRKVSISYEDNFIGTRSLLLGINMFFLNVITPSNLILHTSMKGNKLKSPSTNSYSFNLNSYLRRLGH